MGNSRLIKLALILGRCKVIEAEESDEWDWAENWEPVISRFAYHVLLEFHHQHYPIPKLFPSALQVFHWFEDNSSCRIHIHRLISRLYRWRLKRAKCIGVRGRNWFYHCPKCGQRLFYSPRTHPCPSCTESLAVVGNSELTPTIESNHDPYTDYGISPEDDESDEIDEDDLAFELDKEPEDDW